MRSEELTVRRVPMRWEEEGEGFPVVLVHGIPTDPGLWRHVVPRVTGARCLAFELVGYGRSIPAGRHRDISVARQADYLLGWLEALDIERAVFVGHDLGGGVLQIAALRQPQRCAGLLLTNSIGYDSWPILRAKIAARAGLLVSRLPLPVFRAVFADMIHRGHNSLVLAEEAMQVHFPAYAEHGPAALVRQARFLHTRDTLGVSSRLHELSVPSRVVWGIEDGYQNVEYGERFAWDLDTDLREIPGGHHFTPEDHPDVVAAALQDLLAEVTGRPSS